MYMHKYKYVYTKLDIYVSGWTASIWFRSSVANDTGGLRFAQR